MDNIIFRSNQVSTMATELCNDTNYMCVEKAVFELTWVTNKTGKYFLKI